LLQISLKLPYKTLYVSGEESQKQIKMRAETTSQRRQLLHPYRNQNTKYFQTKAIQPEIVIIDSIQTLHTDYIESLQEVFQIRETTAELSNLLKKPIFLYSNWAYYKDGNIAVLKFLSTWSTPCLQFEGDRNHVYRILRSLKRFGSTAEIGIYEMLGRVARSFNPSEILISHKNEELSGTAIAST
jgi:DNA repair protein RadA/Sms